MNDIARTNQEKNSAVLIPCNTDEFAGFITGLLAAPRKIARLSKSYFNIEHRDLVNLYHLVEQRVSDQQTGSLVAFNVEIFYSDGRSISLPSLHDLQAYAETGVRQCVAVTLSWVFLVNIRGHDHPKKQTVDVTFYTGDTDDEFNPEERFSLLVVSRFGRSSINYLIQHNSVTFGYDMANLLDEEIRKWRRVDKFSEFIRGRWGGALRDALKAVLLFFAAVLSIRMLIPSTAPNVEEFLQQEASGIRMVRLGLAAVTFYVYYLMTSRVLDSIFRKIGAHRPSVISLSAEAKERNDARLKRFERRWVNLILTIGGSFVLGVIASLAANKIWFLFAS